VAPPWFRLFHKNFLICFRHLNSLGTGHVTSCLIFTFDNSLRPCHTLNFAQAASEHRSSDFRDSQHSVSWSSRHDVRGAGHHDRTKPHSSRSSASAQVLSVMSMFPICTVSQQVREGTFSKYTVSNNCLKTVFELQSCLIIHMEDYFTRCFVYMVSDSTVGSWYQYNLQVVKTRRCGNLWCFLCYYFFIYFCFFIILLQHSILFSVNLWVFYCSGMHCSLDACWRTKVTNKCDDCYFV